MNRPIITALCILMILLNISCSDEVIVEDATCDGLEIIIDNDQYNSAPTDLLDIMDLSISDHCLMLSFGSSGCDGESWEVNLFDSGAILESLPIQRELILSLKNIEECDAYFVREYTFDLTNLQVEDNSVLLKITNVNREILYQY